MVEKFNEHQEALLATFILVAHKGSMFGQHEATTQVGTQRWHVLFFNFINIPASEGPMTLFKQYPE